MSDIRLTPHNFDTHLRSALRYKHGFEHADLERAKGIVGDAIEHVEHKYDTKLGMKAEHFDSALEYLHKEHKDWKALSEYKRAHIESALREHFGIEEA